MTNNFADNSGMPGKDCDIYCSHGGIDEYSSVLGYDAVSTDKSLTMFRRRFMHPSSESKKFILLKLYLCSLYSKDEKSGSSETKLFTNPHGV